MSKSAVTSIYKNLNKTCTWLREFLFSFPKIVGRQTATGWQAAAQNLTNMQAFFRGSVHKVNMEYQLILVRDALIDKGVASLIILSSAGYSWGREAEKLWAEIWNLTHESWS